jgi:hypothetical protein
MYAPAMIGARALVLMVAAGCYTQPTYTLNPYEQCALNAMVLQTAGDSGGLYGESAGENGGLYGQTLAQAPGENGGLYGATQGVRCRRPATPAETCAIRSLQASARLKHQSNVGDVPPVSNDQVEYARSSTYQSCMSGAMSGPPGASQPPPPSPPPAPPQ